MYETGQDLKKPLRTNEQTTIKIFLSLELFYKRFAEHERYIAQLNI